MNRTPSRYARGEIAVVIDCADIGRSARFWTGALGYVAEETAAGNYQTLLPGGLSGWRWLARRG